jgi:peptidoglycan/xylan/chitin deacetylase (PgdA/CDA1 family)
MSVRRQIARGIKALLYTRYGRTPGSGVRVLEYHYIDDTGSPLSVSPTEFRRHLEILRDGGWSTLTSAQYLAGIFSGANEDQAPRQVLITFDDGQESFAKFAAPLLREFGFTATVFVVTDLVGTTASWFDRDKTRIERLLNSFAFNHREKQGLRQAWSDFADGKLINLPGLIQLREQGFSLESHSARHHFLTELSASDLMDDLSRSREWLSTHLGLDSRILCYPYGDSSARVGSVAKQAGFQAGMLSEFALGVKNPFAIGRIPMGGSGNIFALRFGLSKAADMLAAMRQKKNFNSAEEFMDSPLDLEITARLDQQRIQGP